MVGFGHLDERDPTRQEPDHVLGDVFREDRALRASDDREAAPRGDEVVAEARARRLLEDARVELPGVAVVVLADRRRRHVVEQERVRRRLLRQEAEATHRGLEVRVRSHPLERPARPLLVARLARLGRCRLYVGRSRRPHRRVDEDRTGESLAMKRGGHHRDEAAHAVADDDRALRELRVVDDREHVARPHLARVTIPPPAVAVPAEIERQHVVTVREERSEEAPPVGVRSPAVNQDDGWLRWCARVAAATPAQVVNRARAFGRHVLRVGRRDRAGEPRR